MIQVFTYHPHIPSTSEHSLNFCVMHFQYTSNTKYQSTVSFFNFNCTMPFFENAVICAMFTDMKWKSFHCQSIINTLSEDESSVLLKYCVVYCVCCVVYCVCCVVYCVCCVVYCVCCVVYCVHCVVYCVCCVVYCICCVVYCVCAATMEIFEKRISDVSNFF